jgi:hypothetical protein
VVMVRQVDTSCAAAGRNCAVEDLRSIVVSEPHITVLHGSVRRHEDVGVFAV